VCPPITTPLHVAASRTNLDIALLLVRHFVSALLLVRHFRVCCRCCDRVLLRRALCVLPLL